MPSSIAWQAAHTIDSKLVAGLRIPFSAFAPHQPSAEAVVTVRLVASSAVHVAAMETRQLAAMHPVKAVREVDGVLEHGLFVQKVIVGVELHSAV